MSENVYRMVFNDGRRTIEVSGPSADEVLRIYNDVSSEPSVDQQPIGVLGLSIRAYTLLRNAGITTVGELSKKSPLDLLALKTFGKTSLREVERALIRHSRALGTPKANGQEAIQS